MRRRTRTPGIVVPRRSGWFARHLSYYRLNILFFTVSPLLFSGIFYSLNGDIFIGFLDSLFMCASALSSAGLETVLCATLSRGQQILLCILMWASSQILLSLVTLLVRIHYFKPLFQLEHEARVRHVTTPKENVSPIRSLPKHRQNLGKSTFLTHSNSLTTLSDSSSTGQSVSDRDWSMQYPESSHSSTLINSGSMTPSHSSSRSTSSSRTVSRHLSARETRLEGRRHTQPRRPPVLVVSPTQGVPRDPSNSLEERVGNSLKVEYRALCLLAKIVAMYFILIPVVAGIVVALLLTKSKEGASLYMAAIQTNGANVNTIWYSVFQTSSGFNYVGFSLIDASMVPFSSSGLYLGVLAFSVNLSLGAKLGLGWFESIMSHSGGFAAVSLSALSPAVQFLYIINFVLGVYPLAVVIRTTKAHHQLDQQEADSSFEGFDDSIGVFETARNYLRSIGVHLRWQLCVDITWVAGIMFLLLTIEKTDLEDPTKTWLTPFSILFEVTAAYSGVGMSLGLPTSSASLSGGLKPLGKLLIIATSIRGCLRGLPIGPDIAVDLPTNRTDLSAILETEAIMEEDESDNTSEWDSEEGGQLLSQPNSRASSPPSYRDHNGRGRNEVRRGQGRSKYEVEKV